MATISEELNKLETTKADIKSALVEKGQNPTDVFSSYAQNIRDIQSGGGGDIDFSKIGYSYTPQFIVDGLKYGEQAYNSVNPDAVNYNDLFGSDTNTLCKELIFFPKITMPAALMNGRRMDNFPFLHKVQIFPDIKVEVLRLPYSCFGPDLKRFHLDGQLYTSQGRTFQNCAGLNDIIITQGIHPDSQCENMFENCQSLKLINFNFPRFGYRMFAGMSTTDYWKDILQIASTNKVVVDSSNSMSIFSGTSVVMNCSIDASSPTSLNGYMLYAKYLYKCPEIILPVPSNNYSYMSDLSSFIGQTVYCATIKNLGAVQGMSSISGWCLRIIPSTYTWEESGITVTPEESRQALIDTLITYSFDRAAAGYSACRITLSSDTKASLTEEEIAQITAKGYTLA